MDISIKRILRNLVSLVIAVVIYLYSTSLMAALFFLAAEETYFSEARISEKLRYYLFGAFFTLSVIFFVLRF